MFLPVIVKFTYSPNTEDLNQYSLILKKGFIINSNNKALLFNLVFNYFLLKLFYIPSLATSLSTITASITWHAIMSFYTRNIC